MSDAVEGRPADHRGTPISPHPDVRNLEDDRLQGNPQNHLKLTKVINKLSYALGYSEGVVFCTSYLMSETAERTLRVRPLQRHHQHSIALMLAMVGFVASCSNADESAIAAKFVASELHFLGSFCEGPYLAVRDGNYISFDGTKYKTLLRNVAVTAIGPDRLSMSSEIGSGNLIVTYLLKHDSTVAIIESVRMEPGLSPEHWATASGIEFRDAIEKMKKIDPLVLCSVTT
ncbi:hypothetical protein [Rhizobium sp. BK456]|uniref:hypothetical protein n=1 Tax=Rhizobium sp. BK456 TaxID=2587007 RepID=UPI001814597C|nr:hypothetical protein [Rhizobium sp. BK456]MBB3524836.1 hypothetical protein [Rhizobium sp. BK456]